ncbi:hypothetical protein NTJ28_002117 [Flavobacterium psychrophilum]|nr:hypothetical protein [Flavobacterium psychrophilum]EKT4510259.1 hypothetical protein [Flavobacterium psychrophilum]
MKKIIIAMVLGVVFISCSKEDCDAKKKAIAQKYSLEIQKAGNDQRKVSSLQEEMAIKLAEPCR